MVGSSIPSPSSHPWVKTKSKLVLTTLVHALATSRIDYCKTLYVVLPVQKLQSISRMDCSLTSLHILMWSITITGNIVGLLGNGFITVVQGHQWLQKGKILPCDFLLINLSASRFMMLMFNSMGYILYLTSTERCLHSYKKAYVTVIWTFMNLASLWSTTWLSVFYCVKVTNFTNCLFLWLKPRINKLVPRLLGMSIVISSIFCVPSVIEYLRQIRDGNLTVILPVNVSQNEPYNKRLFHLQLSYTSINICISIIASTFLLASLWKHTRNLKKSGLGSKDLSTQVHMNVIIVVLSYIFFYLAFLAALIIGVTNVFKPHSPESLITDILATSFPSTHSIILISTNPKLKEMAVHILNIR
ncbi:taste receptor type 2 member 8-like [Anolis sagrei]|uniref:taste receptor type 2 member 8-like n=1 Tax=Anolis sagrei TaxID=38937 RepID=UPI003520807C